MLNRIITMPIIGLIAVSLFLMQCSNTDENEIFKEDVKLALNHYYRAIELRVKKDFYGAEEEVMKSIAISPRPRAYLLLTEIALAQNKLDEAEIYVNQALRLSPNLTLGKELKNQIVLFKGNDSVNGSVGSTIGNALPERTRQPSQPVQSGKIEQPIIQPVPVDVITPIQAPSDAAELSAARDAVNQGNWSEAGRLIQAHLDQQPDSAEGYYLLGYAHFQQKNYNEAGQAFREAVRINPNHAKALNDLGITMEYAGRSAEAIGFYERSVEIGSNPDAFFNLGLLEEKRGEYQKAIALYERYLQQDQQSAFADFARERIRKLRRAEY